VRFLGHSDRPFASLDELRCVFIAVSSFALATASADAKKAPAPSALELEQLQGRDIEGSKDQVFGAVMSALQDSGYRIEAQTKTPSLLPVSLQARLR
jgi:hypothetical protein